MKRADNVREFKRLDREIADGETEVEAKKWRQAELAATAVADGMTRSAYAEQVGVHHSTIGRLVLVWGRWGGADPRKRPLISTAVETVNSGSAELITQSDGRRLRAERKVPTRHEDRVEMAAELLADTKVVAEAAKSAPAMGAMEQAVFKQQKVERDQQRKGAKRIRDAERASAPALPAYMAKMIVRINEWGIGLAGIHDEDLDDLPEGRDCELIIEALQALIGQAERWIGRLERRRLAVIEGGARRKVPA